tara:strand:- start:16 stop:261 length:246 start_codon:yes stop_codon:yes gene_type:complete
MTKAEMIEIIKEENPTIKLGNDEQGYTKLNASEYTKQISEWADARLAKLKRKEDELLKQSEKTALLERLGITAEEAALLLS